MKKVFLYTVLVYFCHLTAFSNTIYVDSNSGSDNNLGTIDSPLLTINKAVEQINKLDNDLYIVKINPGIYVVDAPIRIDTEKELNDKRFVIEASILPGDSLWTPEKMPVIVNISKKGDVHYKYHHVVSFLVEESHVTIRGLKFPGYFYPNTKYFPVYRFNKEETDLLVEQCMFVGDEDASHIQVGVIGHGNEIKVNHCIFHNVKNTVVYFRNSVTGNKTGNSMTNCIVYGAFESAIWTAWPDDDFVFENNIVTKSKFAWIRNSDNPTKYAITTSIIVNNQYYTGDGYLTPATFELEENNVLKKGDIHLRTLGGIDDDLPIDYLHVMTDSIGSDLGAGLFK